ncbi:hypothetical protein GCM10023189_22910 [Nibrella saemangeumensis]|uniref:histidine kinase n=1 Tax=Nibrella saemangeumensis TaxID=1084526 RepID=A0ABP8MV27_9BACT
MRVFSLLLLLPTLLFAQPKGWQPITISDGLSQGMIYDLKQDQNGFIWIATKDGLNRYDGYNVKVFTNDPYNPFSLSDNGCSALLIDRRQRLWVGTVHKGLNLFDDRTQRFYHIDIGDQSTSDKGSYEITVLNEDPDGNIWVGTGAGKLFKVTLPSYLHGRFPSEANITSQVRLQSVSLMETDDNLNRSTHYLNFYPNGSALVGFTGGLFSVNWRQPGKASVVTEAASGLSDFYATYEDTRQGYRFVSVSDAIIGWYGGKQKRIALPRPDNFGVQLKSLDAHTVAVATPDYLWLMSPAELYRQDSLTTRNAYEAIPTNVNTITSMLRDRSGNIWLGTSGYGLLRFNPDVKQFRAYLPGMSLTTLYVDRQKRTYVRYQFAYALLERAANRMVPFLSEKLPEADRRQRHLMQDRQGNFWVSNVHFKTHEQHLFKFSDTWQLLKKYPLPPKISFGFYTNATVEDQDGNLWIGAANGYLLQFNPQTETFTVFSYQGLLPGNETNIETSTLYPDRLGILWLGTQKGLIKVENTRTRPVFTIYKNSVTDQRSLSNNGVLSVINDPYQPDTYLWVGTKGGGLERLHKPSGQFDHFTEAQGLPNKVVYGILADEYRNLWLSTNRGLARFNPRTFTFRNYTKADGLQDDEFNTNSYFRSASGELLFGGVNGLTAFRARDVAGPDAAKPLVHIVSLKVNNKPVVPGAPDKLLTEDIVYSRALGLDHQQNLLTFEFAVMDYTHPAQNRFRYRLAGIDPDWIEAGTNRFANYTQLVPGNYTLQVMGSADGETWSDPVAVQFRIHPPFYLTWWAYLFYAGVLVLLVWQAYRFQMQRLMLQQKVLYEQKEAGRLAELDALKTQFFTSISHEFRTPLTLILGPLADLRQRAPAEPLLTLMERNARRLLALINQLLDLSKLEAGQLKPAFDQGDITAFFRALAGSFQSLAESRQITFVFTQPEPERWATFDRDKLEKIVTNLLGNAFKFTPAGGEVHLSVQYAPPAETGAMTVIVQDTGIGIRADKLPYIFDRFYQVSGNMQRPYEGTGIGLALVNELVGVLGGTIQVASTEGAGTTFTVSLPLYRTAAPAPMDDEPARRPFSLLDGIEHEEATPAGQPLPAASLTPDGTEDKLLLIIDDNADIRAYLRSIFAPEYRIMEAEDGLDGLEKASALLPDLVICDLMMPRLDGFGFCRSLKTQEATSHIPVVMLTARANEENRIEGFDLGADDYLTKPFNRREIQARVRNLLQQRQRLYEWFTTRLPRTAVPVIPPAPLTAEQQFIDRLTALVEVHLDEPAFSVEALAEAANLSRMQLHRKLKALTNTPATDFIRNIRLARAAELLREGDQSVTQIAYAVGFDSLSYFAKVFQERYGKLPSQYRKPDAPAM